jgi:ParB/RepB/Spo0J family partition protein
MDIELDLLSLPYCHMRVMQDKAIKKLMNSIEQFEQRVPAIVIKNTEQTSKPWILVDGYLRYWALKKLKAETICADVWNCDETQALLQLLLHHQTRPWLPFEESLLLNQLQKQNGLSQNQLAIMIGKTRSWVIHRLSLTQSMPETVQDAILSGIISPWAALRVISPVARATPAHAEKLLSYLKDNDHATRELQSFYTHYQKCSKVQKENIMADLPLFFKSQFLIQQEQEAKKLKEGPEGEWQLTFRSIHGLIRKAERLIPSVFYVNQLSEEQEERKSLLNATDTHFVELQEKVERYLNDR